MSLSNLNLKLSEKRLKRLVFFYSTILFLSHNHAYILAS